MQSKVLELWGNDHRVLKANAEAAAEPVFRWPLDGGSDAFLRSWFEKCAGVSSADPTSLPVAYGRTIRCETANGVANLGSGLHVIFISLHVLHVNLLYM